MALSLLPALFLGVLVSDDDDDISSYH
jgi:hypothetical protein